MSTRQRDYHDSWSSNHLLTYTYKTLSYEPFSNKFQIKYLVYILDTLLWKTKEMEIAIYKSDEGQYKSL